MAGWGTCPGCGKKTDLTEHHVKGDDWKKTGEKIMLCRTCHDVVGRYLIALRELRAQSKKSGSA